MSAHLVKIMEDQFSPRVKSNTRYEAQLLPGMCAGTGEAKMLDEIRPEEQQRDCTNLIAEKEGEFAEKKQMQTEHLSKIATLQSGHIAELERMLAESKRVQMEQLSQIAKLQAALGRMSKAEETHAKTVWHLKEALCVRDNLLSNQASRIDLREQEHRAQLMQLQAAVAQSFTGSPAAGAMAAGAGPLEEIVLAMNRTERDYHFQRAAIADAAAQARCDYESADADGAMDSRIAELQASNVALQAAIRKMRDFKGEVQQREQDVQASSLQQVASATRSACSRSPPGSISLEPRGRGGYIPQTCHALSSHVVSGAARLVAPLESVGPRPVLAATSQGPKTAYAVPESTRRSPKGATQSSGSALVLSPQAAALQGMGRAICSTSPSVPAVGPSPPWALSRVASPLRASDTVLSPNGDRGLVPPLPAFGTMPVVPSTGSGLVSCRRPTVPSTGSGLVSSSRPVVQTPQQVLSPGSGLASSSRPAAQLAQRVASQRSTLVSPSRPMAQLRQQAGSTILPSSSVSAPAEKPAY